jgi:hypothetical protein
MLGTEEISNEYALKNESSSRWQFEASTPVKKVAKYSMLEVLVPNISVESDERAHLKELVSKYRDSIAREANQIKKPEILSRITPVESREVLSPVHKESVTLSLTNSMNVIGSDKNVQTTSLMSNT